MAMGRLSQAGLRISPVRRHLGAAAAVAICMELRSPEGRLECTFIGGAIGCSKSPANGRITNNVSLRKYTCLLIRCGNLDATGRKQGISYLTSDRSTIRPRVLETEFPIPFTELHSTA